VCLKRIGVSAVYTANLPVALSSTQLQTMQMTQPLTSNLQQPHKSIIGITGRPPSHPKIKKWRIITNGTKWVQVSFTIRKETCPPVPIEFPENPTSWQSQIFRNTSGSHAKLEKTHIYQAQTFWITTRENVLAHHN